MNPYIFGINIVWGVFKYMNMTTLTSVFMSGPKKGQKWYFGQPLEQQALKMVCIRNLTLGVTWMGSLLATPLSIGA